MGDEWFTLPDGSTVHVPADASNADKARIRKDINERFPGYLSSSSSASPQTDNALRDFIGRNWQGLENIPRALAGTYLTGAQGIAGLLSPHKETALERQINRADEWLYSGIDPRYADTWQSKLGMGIGSTLGFLLGGELGTAAGMARGLPAYLATKRVPAFLASQSQRMANAAALSVPAHTGQAARNIAEYEERTGEDVGTLTELGAMITGGALGITEVLPFYGLTGATGILGPSVRRQLLSQSAFAMPPSLLRGAVTGAATEFLQEAGTELGQTAISQYLYDDEALANIGTRLWDSAIVGGQVGGLFSILTNLSTRRLGPRLYGYDKTMEAEIARLVREKELDETDKRPMAGAATNLDPEQAPATPEEETKTASILELSPEELQERRNRHIELHRDALEERSDPFDQFYEGVPAETIEQEAARRADLDLTYEAQRAQQVEVDKQAIRPMVGLSFRELDMLSSQPIQDIMLEVGKPDGIRPEILLDVFTADRISRLGQDRRNDLRRFIIKTASTSGSYDTGAVASAIAGSWGDFMGQQTEESLDGLFGGKDIPSEEQSRNIRAFMAQALPQESPARQLLETKESLSPKEVNIILDTVSATRKRYVGKSKRGTDKYEYKPYLRDLDINNVWDMVYGNRGGVDLFKSVQDRLPDLHNRWTQDSGGRWVLRPSDSVSEAENELVKKLTTDRAWENEKRTKENIFNLFREKNIRLPRTNSPLDTRGAKTWQQVGWDNPQIMALIEAVTGEPSINATRKGDGTARERRMKDAAMASKRKALLGHIANMPSLSEPTILPDASAPLYTANDFESFIIDINDGKSHDWQDISTRTIKDDAKTRQLAIHTAEAGYITSNATGSKLTLNENSRPQTPIAGVDTSAAETAAEAAEIEESEALNAKALTKLETRVAGFVTDLSRRLKQMGLKDVDLILTAEAGSLIESIEGVMTTPENMRGAYAMLDGPVARIMVNLSAVDPNNKLTSQEIINNYLNEEIWHAYRRYGYMYQHEYDTLRSYALQNVVAPKVNEDANKRGLNYVELALEQSDASGVSLNQQDAAEEGVVIVMDSLARGNLPKSKTAGKVGTIEDKLINFAKNVIDAGRTAKIEDVFSVYELFESGRIGRRGPGFGRLNEDPSKVRSLYYSEYADPEMLERFKSAIIEGDKTKQAKIAQQIVDEQAVISRGASLPGPISGMDRLLNRVMLDRDIQQTKPGAISVLGKNSSDLALDEIFRQRAGAAPYTMPSAVKYRMRKQDRWSPGLEFRSLRDKYLSGHEEQELLPGEIILQSSPYMGSTFNETRSAFESVQKKFLGLLPRSAQIWRDEVLDRSISLEMQERAMTDLHGLSRDFADSSAIGAVRFRDAAGNLFDGVLEFGSPVYMGTDLDQGWIKVVPDGKKTLGDVFAMLRGKNTRDAFKLYSMAQRLHEANLKENLEEAQKIVAAHEAVMPRLLEDVYEKAGLTGPFAVEEYIKQNGAPEGYLTPGELRLFTKRTKEIKASFDKKSKDAVLIDQQTAQELITEIETNAPHVVEAWGEFQRLNDHVIDMALAVGQITPKMAEVFKKDKFVPFYRDIGMVSAWPMGGTGRNRSKSKDVKIGTVQSAHGDTIFDHAIEDSFDLAQVDIVSAIYQNHFAALRDAQTNIAAYRAVRDAKELTEMGWGVQTRRVEEPGPDTLRVMVDGEAQYWQMADPQIVQSVMMLGFSPTNLMLKMMRIPPKVVRATVINFPDFIAANLLRDSGQTYFTGQMGSNPLDAVGVSLEKMLEDDTLVKARMAGIATGSRIYADPAEFLGHFQVRGSGAGSWVSPKDIKGRALTEKWGRRKGVGRRDEDARKVAGLEVPDMLESGLDYATAAWNAYQNVRDRSEVAARMSVYERALAETNNEAEATLQALEVMNYSRRGSNPWVNMVMSWSPFMNGMIQGNDVSWRLLSGSPDIPGFVGTPERIAHIKQQVFTRLATAMGINFIYSLMWSGDEDYETEDDYIKMFNWMIPIPGTEVNALIPIPFTLGAIVKGMPENMVRYMREEDYDLGDFTDMNIDLIQRNFDLHVLPTALRPLENARLNIDELTGDPIVPGYLDELPADLQTDRSTSATAEAISKLFRWLPDAMGGELLGSPMKMENLIRQYFAYAGLYTMMIGDRITSALTDDNVAGTPQDWSRADNVPVLGRFLRRRGMGSARQAEYYKLKDLIDTYWIRVNRLREEDDYEALQKYMDENAGMAAIRPQMRLLDTYMDFWRDRRNQIQDSNLPHKRKTELLDEHIKKRNERLATVADLKVKARTLGFTE